MAVDRSLMPFMMEGQAVEVSVEPPADDSVTIELADGGVEIQLAPEVMGP